MQLSREWWKPASLCLLGLVGFLTLGNETRADSPQQALPKEELPPEDADSADSETIGQGSAEDPLQSTPATPVAQPVVDAKILKDQIEAADRAFETLADGGAAWREKDGPILVPTQGLVSSTNIYQPAEGKRYVGLEFAVWNPTKETVVFPAPEVRLIVDGKEISPGMKEQKNFYVGSYGELHNQPPWQMTPPVNIEIAAGKTSPPIRMVFLPLDASDRIPKLILKYRFDSPGKPANPTRELDINRFFRAKLELKSEQIGPAGCLASVTISSALNLINVQDLIDTLEVFEKKHVGRAVIIWKAGKGIPNDYIQRWLASSVSGTVRGNQQFSIFPVFPNLQEVHFAGFPRAGEGQQRFHATTNAAVLAAVRTVFDTLPLDALIKEIETGHELTRSVALFEGGGRLGVERLPLLVRLSADPDLARKKAAIHALGEYDSPVIIARLTTLVQDEKSAAAFERMCSSRFGNVRQAALDLLTKGLSLGKADQIRILAEHPRPEWNDHLVQACSASDNAIRLVALRAAVRMKHPQSLRLLEAALASPDSTIREFAFASLAVRDETRAVQLAMDYALESLKRHPLTDGMIALFTRARDPRALPYLKENYETQSREIKQSPSIRPELIMLLISLGGEEWTKRLATDFPRLNPANKNVVLSQMLQQRMREALPLALNEIETKDPTLRRVAGQVLAAFGGDEAVEAITKAIKLDPQNSYPFCDNLRLIGTVKAKEALLEMRNNPKTDQTVRMYATTTLQNMRQQSPIIYALQQIDGLVQNKKFEQALKAYKRCQEIDPDAIEPYTSRGKILLDLQRRTEARYDFEQALLIDPFEAKAVIGMAIVQASDGQVAAALKTLSQPTDAMKDDHQFQYNVACVHAVIAEHHGKKPASAERDKLVNESREQALKSLQRSHKLGMQDLEHLRQDKDLDSLREWEPFVTFIKDFKKGTPAEATEGDAKSKDEEAVPAPPRAS